MTVGVGSYARIVSSKDGELDGYCKVSGSQPAIAGAGAG